MLLQALRESKKEVMTRIENVRYGSCEGNVNRVLFDFDGKAMVGRLEGRNVDFVLGYSLDTDKEIVYRILIDKHL